jgi:histidinol-phosphate phosphatase family protein
MGVDQLLADCEAENPILAGLLAVLLDGGRIISTGETSEALLNMVPDILSFERKNLEEATVFSRLSTRDLIFVEKASIDQLWNLAKISGAQIAVISENNMQSELVDFSVQEKDLRSAILGLRNLWDKILSSEKQNFSFDGERTQKALFLDRDGVVIEDTDFVKDPTQVSLIPGVIEALKVARSKGYRLVVVTNQSGIGRGLISWDQYDQVTLKMQELLAAQGIILDRIVVAPFHAGSKTGSSLGRRNLRKPRPGLIHQVVNELRIDISQSVMVGDKTRDLIAAALAGVPKLFLMKSTQADVEIKKWKEWPLMNRVPARNEMHPIFDWPEISKKL